MLKKVSLILFLFFNYLATAFSQDAVRVCYVGNGKFYSTLAAAQADLRSYCDSTMPGSYPNFDGSYAILASIGWGVFWGAPVLEYRYNNSVTGTLGSILICASVAVQYGDMCPNSTPDPDPNPVDETPDDTILEDLTIKDDGLSIDLANNDPLVVDGLPLNTECDTQCSAGDPVNVSSGFMWHMVTDFTLKGRTQNTNLNFNRIYVAHPILSSKALGSHWFHNFQSNISLYRVNKKDNLMWTDEKGGVYIFLKNSDGTYKSPVGFNGSLTEYNDRYELVKSNKIKLIYTKDSSVAPVGSLLTIADPHGEKVLLTYADGLLISAETGLAGKITFSYDENNHLVEVHRVRDNLSHKFSFDDHGNLIKVTDFAGLATTYEYQQSNVSFLNNLLTSFVDSIGRKYSFKYDDSGRVISETEPGNATRYFQYYFNENGERVTKLQEINGSVTSFISDSKYHLIRKIHPNGGISYNSWNEQNKVVGTTDALGYVTKYEYDDNGNVVSILKPANANPTVIDYDLNFNVPSQITSPSGSVTAISIDQSNGDVLEISKEGLSLKYTHDSFGKILSTDNGKQIYSNAVNANGQVISVFDSRNPQTLSYDLRGRIISRKFKSGWSLNFTFDDYDRIIKIDDSHGPSVFNAYDKAGRLISRTIKGKQLSETTAYTWDSRDRLIQVKDALGRITKYQYDNGEQIIDKPTSIITPDGKTTRIEYDRMLQVVKKVDPKNQTTRFGYDLVGNLVSVTDAKNNVTNYQYDGNRRVIYSNEPTVITDSSGKSSEIRLSKSFQYNELDQLIKKSVKSNVASSKIHITRFTYDKRGRMIKRVHQRLGVNNAIEIQEAADFGYSAQLDASLMTSAKNGKQILTFNYEAAPPFKSIAYSAHATDSAKSAGFIEGDFVVGRDYSGEISYIQNAQGASLLKSQFDPAGRLVKISSGDFLGQKSPRFSSELKYDELGRKIGVSNSDGYEQNISYDQLNRIESLNWTRKPSSHFEHDDIYQKISEKLSYDVAGNIIEARREHGRAFYAYDDIGQLISESQERHFRNYQYDVVGNRISDSREGNIEYIANAIIKNKNSVYSYDVDGLGHLTVEFDRKNNIKKEFSYYLSGRLSGFHASKGRIVKELDVDYSYDALGRRIQKHFTFSKEKKSEEFNHAYLFLADEDKILLGRNGKGKITLFIDGQGIDEHLGEVSKNGAKSYITDHLGSVLNTEATEGRKMFGAFGDSFKENIPLSEKEKFSSPVVYGFAGRQLDLESGLYYNRARMYDANEGRFTTKDPIGFKGGDVNLYRYSLNSPARFKDPNGTLFGIDDAFLVVAAVVAPAIVQGVTSAVTTAISGGSVGDIASSGFNGAISGAIAGATAVTTLVFGGQTALAMGAAIALDLAYTALTATGTVDPVDVVGGLKTTQQNSLAQSRSHSQNARSDILQDFWNDEFAINFCN